MYSELDFHGFKDSRIRGKRESLKVLEAESLRLLFRTIVCRPDLGAHIRRFSNYGTVIKSLEGHRPGEDDFFAPFYLPHDVRSVENKADRESFKKVLDQLDLLFPPKKEREEGEQPRGTFPMFQEMVDEHGIALAMINILLLLSPNIRTVSIKINLQQQNQPPLKLPCLSWSSQVAASGVPAQRLPFWLSTFSCLSSFTFKVKNFLRPFNRGTIDALVVGDVLKFPAIEEVSVNKPSIITLKGDKDKALKHIRPSSPLRRLAVEWTASSPLNLTSWLQNSPRLSSLSYRMRVDPSDPDSPGISCDQIKGALQPIRESLKTLEIYYDVESVCRLEVDEAGLRDYRVTSCLGSLRGFENLDFLIVNIKLLLGVRNTAGNTVDLGGSLPPSLKRFYLVDDSSIEEDFCDWRAEDVTDMCFTFIREFKSYTPALELFRLFCRPNYLGPHFDIELEREFWRPQIRLAKEQGLTVELATPRAWERYENSPF